MDSWLSERARSAEAAVPGGFDLTQCVREPIHLLGGIQSYGTLLAVDAASGLVETAARNTGAILGVAAEDLVGGPVTRVLPARDWAECLEATDGDAEDGTAALPVTAGVPGTQRPFDLSVHRRGRLVVLEFEPHVAAAFGFTGLHRGLRAALTRLRSATTVADCCARAVREVRALTGFDRVVAYRFDGTDGPGEVIAEDVREGWEPWLGLWFPATDVPPQARRLYRENWIRVIADVDDESVGLHPPVRPSTGEPLDLSQSVLRTVSGFHLEYLRNIAVRSSMSVSVLREGELWGLIACHGAAPARLSPEVRAECELFGAAFSLQLAAIEEKERAAALLAASERIAAVAALLHGGLEVSLPEHEAAVRDVLDADGLLLVRDGRVGGWGLPAPAALVEALRRRARGLTPGSLWCTDRLSETAPAELGLRYTGSGRLPAGVLMVPLSAAGEFLAWTRAERPMPRRWAADPATPVRVGPHGERLTPRGSSAVVRSVLRDRSLPWTSGDRAAALELWRILTGLVLRHADALAALNEQLRLTNLDLDSFAHAAAHDLKEPLRGISNAATFAIEDAAGKLDEPTLRRLRTTQRLAGRMDELLNSLLDYARLGRSGLRIGEVSLDEVVEAALEVAGPRLAEERVAVVRGPLPTVRADRDRLYEVLVNLLVNAAKYAGDHDHRRVEITVESAVPPGEAREQRVIVVRDNGIGIAPELQGQVFDLFRRLHGPAEHGGGTGVGLAVVRRIVERHGGRLWLDSTPGEGTAFRFTLQAAGDGGPEEAGGR
ncbi:ATP-binding protein [Streptomyces tropicalis]|uniref:Sensor-like histidine kinase SenX3 n=1 Tax=Streptomyces tropicalis TaxID=3034234 RepID=A0ABT6AAH0_9ACTN|nr:ATP-binding protein [Streptomyces tropicalis]MDF3301432.1 ATP-binding protein [Streptomyces tropicalis]